MQNTIFVEFREGLATDNNGYIPLYTREFTGGQSFIPPAKNDLILLPNMKHYRHVGTNYQYCKDGTQYVAVYVLPMAYLDKPWD